MTQRGARSFLILFSLVCAALLCFAPVILMTGGMAFDGGPSPLAYAFLIAAFAYALILDHGAGRRMGLLLVRQVSPRLLDWGGSSRLDRLRLYDFRGRVGRLADRGIGSIDAARSRR